MTVLQDIVGIQCGAGIIYLPFLLIWLALLVLFGVALTGAAFMLTGVISDTVANNKLSKAERLRARALGRVLGVTLLYLAVDKGWFEGMVGLLASHLGVEFLAAIAAASVILCLGAVIPAALMVKAKGTRWGRALIGGEAEDS